MQNSDGPAGVVLFGDGEGGTGHGLLRILAPLLWPWWGTGSHGGASGVFRTRFQMESCGACETRSTTIGLLLHARPTESTSDTDQHAREHIQY